MIAQKLIRSRNVRTCTKPFRFIISFNLPVMFSFFYPLFFFSVSSNFNNNLKPKIC